MIRGGQNVFSYVYDCAVFWKAVLEYLQSCKQTPIIKICLHARPNYSESKQEEKFKNPNFRIHKDKKT